MEYDKMNADWKGRKYEIISLPEGSKNYTNIEFARLKYLNPVRNLSSNEKVKHIWWLAECQCGNLTLIRNDLVFITQSCGCLTKEKGALAIRQAHKKNPHTTMKNLVGQKFNMLKVLEYTDQRKNNGVVWLCQCECGNTVYATTAELKSGHKKSCGCISSWKEKEIALLLNKYQIEYKKEYIFPDLYDIQYLRFDFAIFKNGVLKGLIEYHGKQHYNSDSQWSSETYQKHDKLKEDYCQKNNIPLLILNNNNYNEDIIIKWINNTSGNK